MNLGNYAEPTGEELHRDEPIDDIVSAYIAWGEAQCGLIGGAWSATHASEKPAKLAYWKEEASAGNSGRLARQAAGG